MLNGDRRNRNKQWRKNKERKREQKLEWSRIKRKMEAGKKIHEQNEYWTKRGETEMNNDERINTERKRKEKMNEKILKLKRIR